MPWCHVKMAISAARLRIRNPKFQKASVSARTNRPLAWSLRVNAGAEDQGAMCRIVLLKYRHVAVGKSLARSATLSPKR
jgi:hypothetical protein